MPHLNLALRTLATTTTHLNSLASSPSIHHAATTVATPQLQQCRSHARFYAPMRHHDVIISLSMVILPCLAALFTQLTRNCVYKPPVAPPEPDISSENEETIIALNAGTSVVVTDPEEGEETSIPAPKSMDSPPPYHADVATTSTSISGATTAPTTTSAPPVENEKPQPKPSSAHSFVLGTAFLSLALTSLFLLIFTIQTITYCFVSTTTHPSSPNHPSSPDLVIQILCWLWFSTFATFTLVGIGSWALLFKNLFGKRTREKYVFGEFVVLMVVTVGVMMPFIAVGKGGLWVGEKAVKGCQGVCCAEGLEDEEAVEEGARDGGTELRDMTGERGAREEESGNGSGGGYVEGDEERVGLMAGSEK